MKSKVPEYTKRAIQKYNDKFDRIAVNLPKGTKDEIRELTGQSCNAWIAGLALAELEKIKKSQSMDQLEAECMELLRRVDEELKK